MGGVEEKPPFIEHNVVIGFNALVVGGIKIGHHSYVAAGAIVTKDVPPNSVVIGINKILPNKDWKGKELSKNFWIWK